MTKQEWKALEKVASEGALDPQMIASVLGISLAQAKKYIFAFNQGFVPIFLPEKKFNDLDMKKVLSFIKNQVRSINEIGARFKLSSDEVIELMNYLGLMKYNVKHLDNSFTLDKSFPTGRLDLKNTEREIHVGFVSDQHLGSHWERRDVLDEAYDYFAANGVNTVFNAGNYIEGEARFNLQDVKVHGMHPQINYAALHYPYRPGVKTYFIDGDDHEGWYSQRFMVKPGELLQMTRNKLGLNDLVYMGYLEADIRITSKEHGWEYDQIMRLAHPGGGTAYAVSYKYQKIVESFQGGEKPIIYAAGHYHKFVNFLYRNVHILGIPCMEDQSIFGRKQGIEFHIGYVHAIIHISSSGLISGWTIRYFNRYDRKFYTEKNKFQKY